MDRQEDYHEIKSEETEAECNEWSSFRWCCTAKKEDDTWRIIKFYIVGGKFKESELFR